MIRTIIDGYNLIFQCGLHVKNMATPTALEGARNRLIRELKERIPATERSSVMIVYDANTPIGIDQVEFAQEGFPIRFAKSYPDADSMIRDLIEHHSHPKRLTVVSSDHQVQTAATRRNANPIDSDVWFDGLRIQKHSASNRVQRSVKNTEPKENIFIDDFNSIDVQAIQDEIDRNGNPVNDDAEEPPIELGDEFKRDANEITGDTFDPFPPGYGEDLLD